MGLKIVGTTIKLKVLVLATILVPSQVYFVSFIRHSTHTNLKIVIFLETCILKNFVRRTSFTFEKSYTINQG